jgi:hypothetical protein
MKQKLSQKLWIRSRSGTRILDRKKVMPDADKTMRNRKIRLKIRLRPDPDLQH